MVSRQFQHPTLLGLLDEKYRVHRLWEASEPEEFIKNHCQGARAMVTDHFGANEQLIQQFPCLLYTSPSPRDRTRSRMPSSA